MIENICNKTELLCHVTGERGKDAEIEKKQLRIRHVGKAISCSGCLAAMCVMSVWVSDYSENNTQKRKEGAESFCPMLTMVADFQRSEGGNWREMSNPD